MSEAWERTRRRRRLVHAVLDRVSHQGIPLLTNSERAEIDVEFGDLDGFLGEVQAYWYRAFDARLDQLLEEDDLDLGTQVDALWRAPSREQPGARRLLDTYADHPVLAAGAEHHRRRLLAATGVDRHIVGQQRSVMA
jgi:hypothetical protein